MKNRIKRVLARLGTWMEDLLFPADVLCLCCDAALGRDAENGICASCRAALDALALKQQEVEAQGGLHLPKGIAYIHSAFVYEGPVRKLVHRLKYESVRQAAVPLAEQMAFLPSGEEEIIVPVPTDKKRERRRGFNQSALLAERIGKELGMQVIPALRRVESRRPQTGLTAREREQNLVGCMASSDAVSGKRVLLVDDVCTTGATLREAGRALCKAGALHVGVFTAARAQGLTSGEEDPFAVRPERAKWGKR